MMTLAVNGAMVVQVQVPDGTSTRSPLAAELMAACTSFREQETALMSAACNDTGSKSNESMEANINCLLLIQLAIEVLTGQDCGTLQKSNIMFLIILQVDRPVNTQKCLR
jgi:hypothetical protein